MKNHQSIFLYPYVIKTQKLNRYIQGLLKNSKCTLKIFEKRTNLSMYNYFLPTARDYMFRSFGFAESNTKALDSLSIKLKANMLSSMPCTIFEYNMGQDVQAKTDEEDGLFFKIQKIEIICFSTGICFLAIKTNLEGTEKFSDLLNFNFRFRDINSEENKNLEYNKIKIQTGTFSDIKKLSELIKELTGSAIESKKIDIDTNRFIIYSYACIDNKVWNEKHTFDKIQNNFNKFANVLEDSAETSGTNDRLKTINLGEYIKMGISSAGTVLLYSDNANINHSSISSKFENEYFYTYIFALYNKYYLNKILNEFKNTRKAETVKTEFLDFTNDIWIHEMTNNDDGILMYKDLTEVLELESTYEKVKRQYDIAYKDYKVNNNEILNKIILVLLVISGFANIVNFIILYNVTR